MQHAYVDIAVTLSLVSIPHTSLLSLSLSANVGPRSLYPNVRDFLDVGTLAGLCRVTCGKFKWLHVGNEFRVAIGDNNNGDLS